jgi:hypothetical protein
VGERGFCNFLVVTDLMSGCSAKETSCPQGSANRKPRNQPLNIISPGTTVMSRLSNIRVPLLSSSQPSLTPAPDTPWTLLGLGKEVLLPELEALYWEGVRGELENIIRTLNTWNRSEFSDVKVDDEDDTFIHGFDTFIDQVTEESRAFAIRYGEAPLHVF